MSVFALVRTVNEPRRAPGVGFHLFGGSAFISSFGPPFELPNGWKFEKPFRGSFIGPFEEGIRYIMTPGVLELLRSFFSGLLQVARISSAQSLPGAVNL